MSSIAGLEQLRSGFITIGGMDVFIKKHLDLLKGVFAAPAQRAITALYIEDEFVPILSPKGSNNLSIEEDLVVLWNRYLEHVEGEFLYYMNDAFFPSLFSSR